MMYKASDMPIVKQAVVTLLGLMSESLGLMLDDRSDGRLGFGKVTPLDVGEIVRLHAMKEKVDSLRKDIVEQKGLRSLSPTLEMICDCPVHLKHFDKMGITSLADFHRANEETILFVLRGAESSGGKRQYHLYPAHTAKQVS
jgi:hypothetical protein